jgi:hypothetical protein
MNEEIYTPASINEYIRLIGDVNVIRHNEFGEVTLNKSFHNLVVTTGKNFIASRLGGASSPVMSHMELGTSNAAAVVGDTTLVAAISGSRTALTSLTSGVPTANAIRHIATFAAGVGTGNLVEAGLFNASTAGTLLCRTVFGIITKGALDSVTITWDLTIS